MLVKEINREALYTNRDLIKISKTDIEAFKKKMGEQKGKPMRLYCHKYADDTLQEMLIIYAKDVYVRPHKHLNKSESFHVVEGQADVVLFNEQGSIEEVISMGDSLSGRKIYYRMSIPRYHTLIVHSDFLVFHKITKGPFQKADTVFAPWAPQEDNAQACQEYKQKLRKKIAEIPPEEL